MGNFRQMAISKGNPSGTLGRSGSRHCRAKTNNKKGKQEEKKENTILGVQCVIATGGSRTIIKQTANRAT